MLSRQARQVELLHHIRALQPREGTMPHTVKTYPTRAAAAAVAVAGLALRPAGSYTLRVRLIGYRSQTRSVTVAAGQRATEDFALTPDPLNLEAVVVTGTETPRTKLETSNATTVLSAADLTQAAPRSTTEALRYVPGFTRVESSGGEVNENITMRGILGV